MSKLKKHYCVASGRVSVSVGRRVVVATAAIASPRCGYYKPRPVRNGANMTQLA